MAENVTVNEFIQRFETLKRQFFAPSKHFDENSDDVPPAGMDKTQIVKIFDEHMNLEIPIHPGEPPIVKGNRKAHMYGEWWKNQKHQTKE